MNPLIRLDELVVRSLAPFQGRPLGRAAWVVGKVLGEGPLGVASGVVSAGSVAAGHRGLALAAGRVTLAVVAAVGAKNGVKRIVTRTRPSLLFEEGMHEIRLFGPAEGRWQSFPSGHLAGGVAAGIACVAAWPWTLAPVLLAVALLAFARVQVGSHYPSDVAGGIALGLAVGALIVTLVPL